MYNIVHYDNFTAFCDVVLRKVLTHYRTRGGSNSIYASIQIKIIPLIGNRFEDVASRVGEDTFSLIVIP